MPKIKMTVTVENETKDAALNVLQKVGLDMSSAVNLFLAKVVNSGGIPFDVTAGGKGPAFTDICYPLDMTDEELPRYTVRYRNTMYTFRNYCCRIIWTVTQMNNGEPLTDKQKTEVLLCALNKLFQISSEDEVRYYALAAARHLAEDVEDEVQPSLSRTAVSVDFLGHSMSMNATFFVNAVAGLSEEIELDTETVAEIIFYALGFLEGKINELTKNMEGLFSTEDAMTVLCREFAAETLGCDK